MIFSNQPNISRNTILYFADLSAFAVSEYFTNL